MANEKMLNAISAIDRALGKIEGVAFVLEDKYSMPLLDAIEVIDGALEDIKNGK